MNRANDKLSPAEAVGAAVAMTAGVAEKPLIMGRYTATLLRVDDEFRAEAEELSELIRVAEAMKAEQEVARLLARLQALPRHVVWTDEFPNTVMDLGARDILDKYIAGSAYTASIFMGLKGAGVQVAADTMASHATWTERGGTNAPAYTGNRPTPTWSAATGAGAGNRIKQTASAVNFVFTSGGQVDGCFIVSGGSATKDNTTGILLSAGDFSGGAKTVANTDQLNVTYSLSM